MTAPFTVLNIYALRLGSTHSKCIANGVFARREMEEMHFFSFQFLVELSILKRDKKSFSILFVSSIFFVPQTGKRDISP